MAEDFAAHGEPRYLGAAGDFDDFLRRAASDEEDGTLPPGRVPVSQYWLVSEGRVLGCSRLRHRLTSELAHEGGHVGYDIRPSARGRGFGTSLLLLTRERAAARGIDRLRITCDVDNRASIRVIEKNAGILDAVVPSRTRDTMICQYWVASV
jgi:predicted acetyltransferase